MQVLLLIIYLLYYIYYIMVCVYIYMHTPFFINYVIIDVLNTQCHREGWEYLFVSFFTITLMTSHTLTFNCII